MQFVGDAHAAEGGAAVDRRCQCPRGRRRRQFVRVCPWQRPTLFSDQDLSTLVGHAPRRANRFLAGVAVFPCALMSRVPGCMAGAWKTGPSSRSPRRRPLWGTGADALRSVRDPAQLQRALRRAGMAFPEFVRPDGAAPPVGWLVQATSIGRWPRRAIHAAQSMPASDCGRPTFRNSSTARPTRRRTLRVGVRRDYWESLARSWPRTAGEAGEPPSLPALPIHRVLHRAVVDRPARAMVAGMAGARSSIGPFVSACGSVWRRCGGSFQ